VVLAVVVYLLLTRCERTPDSVRVAAVGDMACDPDDPQFLDSAADMCRQETVSDLAVVMDPTVLLGLGDFQYELPTMDAYRDVYGPTYGRLLNKTIPVYGNQEYKVQDANTFTAYFGDRIRDPRGYWSQDVGRWHIVVLNSNCAAVAGGCGKNSPQQQWLAADLKANPSKCVLAAWHHPRWSSGIAGSNERVGPLYQTLYSYHVDLLLSGHDADYERFGPLNPDGRPDDKGLRQFVVGTGGQAHYKPVAADTLRDEEGNLEVRTGQPRSDFTDFTHHGVLQLDLGPKSYKWIFHALDGSPPEEDTGSAQCH
jgi:hypothetical protein